MASGAARLAEQVEVPAAIEKGSPLPRMRFTPARAGGRAVRQLVEFPVVFRIER